MLNDLKRVRPLAGASQYTLALGVLLGGLVSPGCGEGETHYSEAPTPVDLDQDDYLDDVDCNDEDESIYPGAPEDPEVSSYGDGIDNDCDGYIDEDTDDGDDDGDGYTERQGDCDDENAVIYPERTDGCDGIDNDCDDRVDESAQDSYEPNNDKAVAVDFGDLTCQAKSVYLNLLAVDGSPDSDFFRVDVDNLGEDAPPGCTFGLTATLAFVSSGELISMRLYDATQDTPLDTVTISGSGNTDSGVVQWAGDGDSATFYVQVTSQGSTAFCQDDMRLTIQGMAAPTLPSPN